jgi:hypothetical protein
MGRNERGKEKTKKIEKNRNELKLEQRKTVRKETIIERQGLTPWNGVLQKLSVAQLVKDVHSILLNPKVHYPADKSPPLVPIVS